MEPWKIQGTLIIPHISVLYVLSTNFATTGLDMRKSSVLLFMANA